MSLLLHLAVLVHSTEDHASRAKLNLSVARFSGFGSPHTDTANWNSLTSSEKEIINRILVNCGKAIEACLRKLVSRNAAFDRYVAGNGRAISVQARQGLRLFIGKAGCVRWHNTPLFSDDDFHVIGLHIDTTLSPRVTQLRLGVPANQAFICNPSVADGDFNVNGHFSDDPDSRGSLAD